MEFLLLIIRWGGAFWKVLSVCSVEFICTLVEIKCPVFRDRMMSALTYRISTLDPCAPGVCG